MAIVPTEKPAALIKSVGSSAVLPNRAPKGRARLTTFQEPAITRLLLQRAILQQHLAS